MRAQCLLLCAAVAANAIELVKKDHPAVVELATRRKPFTISPAERDRLRRRASTVSVNLDNDITLYLANASLGTPAQDFQLHIDTGSSDLWVNTASSNFCQQNSNGCSQAGVYSPNKSSTYSYVDSDFSIRYVDGSGANGDYVSDVFTISNVAITGFQFGIGYTSSTSTGILGIGYQINEVAVDNQGRGEYPNLPVALKNAGMTNSVAYSLWLNDLDANVGSILFGGVNSAKYVAPLYTVPIVKESGYYAEFIIALTALGQNGQIGSIANNVAIPVLLDSGSSLTYLPDSIANSMFEAFGATWYDDLGAAVVQCSLARASGSIDYTFSDSANTIRVNLDELVLTGGVENGREFCILGVARAGNNTAVLGDTFLRSAYVVYDLEANTVSLAQASYNTTGDDVQEIAASSTVPGATAVPSPVTDVGSFSTGSLGRVGSYRGTNAGARITPGPMLPLAAAAAVGFGAMWF